MLPKTLILEPEKIFQMFSMKTEPCERSFVDLAVLSKFHHICNMCILLGFLMDDVCGLCGGLNDFDEQSGLAYGPDVDCSGNCFGDNYELVKVSLCIDDCYQPSRVENYTESAVALQEFKYKNKN